MFIHTEPGPAWPNTNNIIVSYGIERREMLTSIMLYKYTNILKNHMIIKHSIYVKMWKKLFSYTWVFVGGGWLEEMEFQDFII